MKNVLIHPALGDEAVGVMYCMMKVFGDSGAADDMLDPVGEPGDASVDAVVVWTPTTFAPAHHAG